MVRHLLGPEWKQKKGFAVSPRERGNVSDLRTAEKAKEAQKDVDLGAPYDRDTHFLRNDERLFNLRVILFVDPRNQSRPTHPSAVAPCAATERIVACPLASARRCV